MPCHKLLIVLNFTGTGARRLQTINLYSAPDIASHIAGQKPGHSRDKAVSIRVISDGTTGMRLQALALGEAIKESQHPTTNLEDIITTPSPLLRHLPRLARYLPLSWVRLMVGPKLAAPSNSNPALIITCGRRMAGLSIAMRRLGTPEDIASAVLFFTSDQASWITGQVLSVDGGR